MAFEQKCRIPVTSYRLLASPEHLHLFHLYLILEEAEKIMEEERSFLDLPSGMPTFQSIEEARLKAEGRRS